MENPLAYINTNIVILLIFEKTINYNVEQLVYASTSSVWSYLPKCLFSNTSVSAHNLPHVYAASKKSNELMAHVQSYLFTNYQRLDSRFFIAYRNSRHQIWHNLDH